MSTIEEINVKNVYEIIASHFSCTRTYQWSWVTNFLESLKEKSIVYDLGCGNGRNMIYNNLSFVGIDNCKNFVNICRKKNLNVIESNLMSIPLKDESCDAIICIAVFHHFSCDENRLKVLNEIYRLLKPDGKILLSVWSINQPLKTRRIFNTYGTNIVSYNKNGNIYNRYYYIFQLDEIKKLFEKSNLFLSKYYHDCGNEIFELKKIILN